MRNILGSYGMIIWLIYQFVDMLIKFHNILTLQSIRNIISQKKKKKKKQLTIQKFLFTIF